MNIESRHESKAQVCALLNKAGLPASKVGMQGDAYEHAEQHQSLSLTPVIDAGAVTWLLCLNIYEQGA